MSKFYRVVTLNKIGRLEDEINAVASEGYSMANSVTDKSGKTGLIFERAEWGVPEGEEDPQLIESQAEVAELEAEVDAKDDEVTRLLEESSNYAFEIVKLKAQVEGLEGQVEAFQEGVIEEKQPEDAKNTGMGDGFVETSKVE